MKDKRIQSAVEALGYLALHEGKERVRLPRAFAVAGNGPGDLFQLQWNGGSQPQ